MGRSRVVDHRTPPQQKEYESTYGIQEVNNGIKMGFVTTTKYHGWPANHSSASAGGGCMVSLATTKKPKGNNYNVFLSFCVYMPFFWGPVP